MPEGMCKADGCDKPIGKAGGRGMCQKHLKRWRELRGALGLPLPPREAPRRSRASAPKRPGACLVADCHKPEGKFGGEGRCKTHLAEYREERRRAGKPLPLSNASKVLRDEPGYEIEDWPEDQHYGLSVDGICSAPWGCGQPVGRKGARGLCSKHVKRWADAYRARGLTPPKRSSGRDPRCRLPDDDTLVQLVRDHGSYNKVAEACDVTRSTLQDFLDRRPALKARMDAEWRLIYKPRTYKTEEQRRAREQERGRQARRRRGLVSAERLAFGAATPEDAEHAWAYANVLDSDPCSYCGGEAGTIDHIVPLAKEGDVRWVNLTAACARCNSAKNDRHLLQHLLDTRESRGERMRQLATFTPEWSHGGVLVLAAALAAASPCQDVPLPEGLLA